MGSHQCEYCYVLDEEGYQLIKEDNIFVPSSTGDITLIFPDGKAYTMPDMILHYIHDHGWKPSEDFIISVMDCDIDLVITERLQTKGLEEPTPVSIGYLEGDFEQGAVPVWFKEKLELLLVKAIEENGWKTQLRRPEHP